MNEIKLKHIVEALLLNSDVPLSNDKLLSVFDDIARPTREQLMSALVELEADYADRAVELKKLASGYCLQTKAAYAPWVTQMVAEKPAKYSMALLEILSIIAYRQPVTRADIEYIRGVAVSSSMLKTLLEREWIRIAGHRDVPGKPAVYVTTNHFLDYFNLASLNDLPSLQG
jgi:segregation and condensation protein B